MSHFKRILLFIVCMFVLGDAVKRLPENNVSTKLLPSKRICGMQQSDSYLRTAANDTAISEFPWLALITDNTVPFMCTGTLISTKYVLTVAHCLMDPKMKPLIVRLGEYHIKNKTDCIKDSRVVECSDSVQDYGIAKIVIHPKYVLKQPPRHASHDIGLIRLNRTVKYTDYIRPICLPLSGLKSARVGDILVASGWGILPSKGELAKVKKRSYVTLISNEECNQMFYNLSLELDVEEICPIAICPEFQNYSVTLGEGDICGSTTNSDSICGGDEGSPVMFSHRSRWRLEGIVSLSSIFCNEYVPNVFTKVVYYLDWIMENLES